MTASTEELTSDGHLWFLPNLVRVHVDAPLSGGAFSLIELSGRRGDPPGVEA